ncbi:MAG: kinase [Deltaproteobacteria bacterium RIFCSPHIGHO2_12_FULL_43_9]|nr:MAG: kinase [Deltaproteobacteria bacterium RIFCSPHIGHO2_12_FULL_43_9]
MIISRTPYRISFFGGGTDYPVWYRENGGAVLSTSINKYCYITCRYLPPFFQHKSRIVYSKIEDVKNNEDIEHPAVRETLKYLDFTDGVEIHHDGDLPARTGLGSSSSFTVGLLHGLYGLKQIMPTKMKLALEAIYMERDVLKENVGNQDQVCAAHGGLNKISFTTDDKVRIDPIIINMERLRLFEKHLMLYFTGFSRFASQIAAKQIRATKNKMNELRTMYQMVDEGLNILTTSRDLIEFGDLLHEGWLLKRSLTDLISTTVIDEIYETARSAGAVGGKLLGAGGGGFMLFFVNPDDQKRVKGALKGLLRVPFKFETGGSQVIFYEPNAYNNYKKESYTLDAMDGSSRELIWTQ